MSFLAIPQPPAIVRCEEEFAPHIVASNRSTRRSTEASSSQKDAMSRDQKTPGEIRQRDIVLKRLLTPLEEAAQQPEDDDLPPTPRCLALAKTLLTVACYELVLPLPRGVAYSDGDGGLRVDWSHNERQVRLVLSHRGSDHDYLYHQNRDNYAIETGVNTQMFVDWLQWMQGAVR